MQSWAAAVDSSNQSAVAFIKHRASCARERKSADARLAGVIDHRRLVVGSIDRYGGRCSAAHSGTPDHDRGPAAVDGHGHAAGLAGFVWLGTEDGLVRYDGHLLHRYAAVRGEPGSLSGNYIWDIAEDAGGDLWIAIRDGGVARWRRKSDTFTIYRHDPSNPDSLASDSVRALLVDSRGHVWIGTSDAGVDVPRSCVWRHPTSAFDGSRPGRAQQRSHLHAVPRTLGRCLDRHARRASTCGVARMNRSLRSALRPAPRARSWTQEISHVLEDKSGAVWVSSFKIGLTRLDRDGRLLAAYRQSREPNALSNDDVRSVLEDQAGRLWVGTADGLELLDRASGQFTHFRHDDSNADSLRDSFVMSLYEDQAGVMWIGTRTGGVSRWNPRSWELGGQRPAMGGERAGECIRRCRRWSRLDCCAGRRIAPVRSANERGDAARISSRRMLERCATSV